MIIGVKCLPLWCRVSPLLGSLDLRSRTGQLGTGDDFHKDLLTKCSPVSFPLYPLYRYPPVINPDGPNLDRYPLYHVPVSDPTLYVTGRPRDRPPSVGTHH